MGAWGPAIFSDDTARDVRDYYRELLETKKDDYAEFLRKLVASRHLNRR